MANQISHRYNHLPLLPSSPGGFDRSWSYRFAAAKVRRFPDNYLGSINYFREYFGRQQAISNHVDIPVWK